MYSSIIKSQRGPKHKNSIRVITKHFILRLTHTLFRNIESRYGSGIETLIEAQA